MDESVEIPVTYRGEEYSVKAQAISYGYSHRIVVHLNEHSITLEPGEDMTYRTISLPGQEYSLSTMEQELLKEIIIVLDSLT